MKVSKQSQKEKPKYRMDKIDINIEACKHVFQANGTPIYSPFPLYEGQKMYVEYMIECLSKRVNGLIQSPTGTGKTLSLLCSTLSWVRHEQLLGRQPIRIIYTSRTHAQLKQVVQQLIKTGFSLKLAILGSRDHTCINDDLKQLSGQGKELECRLRVVKKNGLFCKYFHNEDFYAKMNGMGRVADLQQMKILGKTQEFCPFYYQKYAKTRANLILMPYNYLLDERSSNNEELSELVQGSIMIFDQAHNIPSVCENSKQFSISLATLSRALHHLGDLRQQKLQQQKKLTNKKAVLQEEQQKKLMKSSVSQLQIHASYVTALHAHMQTLNIALQQGLVMNVHDFLQCMDNGTEESQSGKLRGKIKQLNQSAVVIHSDIMLKPYWALQAWLQFVARLMEMYSISNEEKWLGYFKTQVCYSGSDIKINLLCLDPKIGFQRIIKNNPHCAILTSGTLSPLNSMALQLETEFNKPLACPHIMSKQQVNGCILTAGPNKVKLNFSFQNRDNSELYKELGSILYQIVNKTPNGVIIFVPSYSMLEKVKIQLTNSGVMTKLYAKKNIFFEKSNSSDFKAILDKYLEEATKSKGALLFALARGKISEGLDFSDQKCRAVIMVGVPYPSSKDLKVKSKMQYLDMKSKQTKSMNGNQWYICETIRTINQSIGRIIRNKNDYGSIYLLDQRFKKNQLLSQISSWARECLKIVDNFQEFKFKLELFQQYFRKKNEQSEEVQHFFTSHLGTKLTNKINPDMKPVKASISMSKNQYMANTVRPQVQFQAIKAQSKRESQAMEQKVEPSRQKIIFGRNKKSTPAANTLKQCPICRQQRALIKNTECIHEICEQCWDIWLKKDLRCPVCRVRVREKYLLKS